MRPVASYGLSAIAVAFVFVAAACSEAAEAPTMPVAAPAVVEPTQMATTRAEMPQAELLAGSKAAPSLASGHEALPDAIESRARQVEQGLRSSYGDPAWKRMRLSDRMAHHNVPGVGIAIIDDYRIEWAKGYGVLTAGRSERITPGT